jgi:hypothetical protein
MKRRKTVKNKIILNAKRLDLAQLLLAGGGGGRINSSHNI